MRKILIVEDEEELLALLHSVLVEEYEVINAEDGKQGLEIALKEHPDLILLDIKMPLMDGWEMLNELRKDDYGKDAKIIILTNLDVDKKEISHVVQEQPIAYWVKSDIKILDIADKLKKVLAE